MHQIGPYRFTEQDVERTLAHRSALFDLLPGGRTPDPVAPHRAAVGAMTDAEVEADPHGTLEVLWREWRAAMEAVRAAGAYGPRAEGTVAGIFAGRGGVPKQAIDEAVVGWSGFVGDVQATRVHHGRPWQALCLWSVEVIDRLNGDGHQLFPGAAGENVALAGLPWDRVVPGAQLQIGAVRCELSAWALPCSKNARWFDGGDVDAMHHRNGPVSRVYATVLEPGTIRAGDPAVLEPDA